MEFYHFFVLLIALSAGFSYVNIRFLKLPYTIGLMVLGILFSLCLVFAKSFFPYIYAYSMDMMAQIDFSKLILEGMLSFMLFAGALHTDSSLLKSQSRSVAVLALVGVLLSTGLIGAMLFGILQLLHIPLPFIYCFLFGALISPTDPIAVLGILTKAKVPKKIEINIVGESLFNDGVGVVIFISVLELIRSGNTDFSVLEVGWFFIKEAGGGILFGALLGFGLIKLLKSIDHFETEVMITLAFVMGGYLLAHYFHVSGPLAIVLMGLMVGGKGKEVAMSKTTELYVFKFWELVDVIMNAIFFVLIGLRVLVLDIKPGFVLAGIAAIVIVLLSRLISVRTAVWLSGTSKVFDAKSRMLLVWGGLRGGLSIALALSLSQNGEKDLLVFITYMVVLFSILVQGLTISKLAKGLFGNNDMSTVSSH